MKFGFKKGIVGLAIGGSIVGAFILGQGTSTTNDFVESISLTSANKDMFGSKEIIVPDTASAVVVKIIRNSIPDTGKVVASIYLECFDGQKWDEVPCAGTSFVGGQVKNKSDVVSTETKLFKFLTPGKGRKIKIRVESEVDFNTTVTADFI